MSIYKLIVAYDGTDFHGWQEQAQDQTISSVLQKSFAHIFQHKISIVGASRTDSGVHALGQVAKIKTDLDLSPDILIKAWNNSLPKSILIRKLEKIDNSFHPQSNVLQKIYYYNLFTKRPLPFFARYGWYIRYMQDLDLDKFYKNLKLYEGEHDFTSFCKIEKGEIKNTIRKIDSVDLEKFSKQGLIRITIKGKSFLRFQIRRMIGYALDVSRQDDLDINYLKDILLKPDKQQKLFKADACGLILSKIIYK